MFLALALAVMLGGCREEAGECGGARTVRASYELKGVRMSEWIVNQRCLVDSLDTSRVELACGSGEQARSFELVLTAEPAVTLPLRVGDEVELIQEVTGPILFFLDHYLTLRDPSGRLVLAAARAPMAAPSAPELFAPLSITDVDLGCPPIETECGTSTRRALELATEAATVLVPAFTAHDTDEWAIRVGAAGTSESFRCVDTSGSFYEYLVVRRP